MEKFVFEAGIGLLVAYLIIKEFIFFFRREANSTDKRRLIEIIEAQEKKIEDLWKWHAKEDDDGRKIWYNRRSIEKAIVAIEGYSKTQTELFKSMKDMFKENQKILQEMRTEFHDLQKDVSSFITSQ